MIPFILASKFANMETLKSVGKVVAAAFLVGVGYAVFKNVKNKMEADNITEPNYQLAIQLNTALANWWSSTNEDKVFEICKQIHDSNILVEVNQHYISKYGESIEDAITGSVGLSQIQKNQLLEILANGVTQAPVLQDKSITDGALKYALFPFFAPTLALYDFLKK